MDLDEPDASDPGFSPIAAELRAALERSVDGVAVLDGGRHARVNAAYARLLDRSDPASLEEVPLEAVLSTGEPDRLREEVGPAVRSGGSWRGEVVMRAADGERVPVDLSLTRLDDDRLLCVARDLTEQHRSRQRLRRLAYYDPLTGLANRRFLRHHAEQAAALARRHSHEIALVYLDLNHFKEVNDTLGHGTGDQVLEQVGARLQEAVREADTAARVGGDEFAVLLSEVGGEEGALRAARRILGVFDDPFRVEGHEIELEAGLGIAFHPRYAEDFDELVEQADLAMYGSERRKEHGIRIYRPELGGIAPRRPQLVDELHEALRHYRLELHFQPVRALADGKLHGAEARVRWPHPRLGLLSAAKFLPLVEEAGLLRRLDRWVLARSAVQLREWAGRGFDGWLGVHLSEAAWRSSETAEHVRTGLDALRGLEAGRLVVQMPATAGSNGRLTELREELGALGAEVAVNAFAPGLAPLETLRRLAPDMINLVPGLVGTVRPEGPGERLLRVTVDAGHTLGARIMAKGVERREQQSAARRAGCDLVQGYLVGWPVPPDEFPVDESC